MNYTEQNLWKYRKTLFLSHADKWFSDIYPTWCDYKGGIWKYLRRIEILLLRWPQIAYWRKHGGSWNTHKNK